jgi:serine phosphatase RsbU (regulator of sigma subunit)
MAQALKTLSLILILSFFFRTAPAQDQHRIDSLLHALPNMKEDTNKVLLLYSLAWEISYKNLTAGIQYAERGAELATSLNFQYGLSRNYHALGSIYVDLGDLAKANDYLYKELRILEKIHRTEAIASCYVELGILHQQQHNLTQALHYDTLALQLYQKTGNTEAIIASNLNISGLYSELKNYRKALEINITDLELFQGGKGKKEQLASSYTSIGMLYLELGNYPEAKANLTTGFRIYRQEKLTYFFPQVMGALGRYYVKTDNPKMAIAYFDSSLTFLRQTGQREMEIDAYSNLSDCYESIKDYKNAHLYHKLYSTLKDSVFNDEKLKEMTQNEMNYEFDKVKATEKLKREKKEALEASELKREHLILYTLGIGFFLLLIFAFIIYRGYREKKKVNDELKYKNNLIEEKNKSITDSINYAKRIQGAILPSDKRIHQLLPDSFVLFKPKDIVSGDFYWVEKTGNKVLFTAVDCTGHGVPGAMVSVVGHNNLNRCVKEFKLNKPAEVLDKLNELVQETFEKAEDEVKDGMDLALCSLNTDTLVLEFAGANNPLWISKKEGNTWILTEIKANKQPIGKYATSIPFTGHTLQLSKGECIYIFSDGYADQFGGESGKKFKYKNLKELLLSMQHKSMEEQKASLLQHFTNWQQQLEQVDDVLIIGVRV